MCYGELISENARKLALLIKCDQCGRPLQPGVRHAMFDEISPRTLTTLHLSAKKRTKRIKLHHECVEAWDGWDEGD